ncbi:MAG: 6-pyruvoyl tetrahydropterin synthase family protein [Sumerlaeia bacterium]
MEKIRVLAKFHTGHRQIGYPGHCAWVHGHTWRGSVTVITDEFPRDHLDMALDFGDLKKIMRDFDHRMIVTANDPLFTNPELFEPEGVIVIPGKGPSVENVATYVWNHVVKHIEAKFPGQKKTYSIEVEIQETDNNFFTVLKDAVV